MKNKKLLSVLASKLKIDEKLLLAASDNETGDDSVLKEFDEKHQILALTEVETIKKNARAAGVEEHFAKADFDIDKDIPSPIAAKLLGRKLEGKQLALAKKYDVTDAKDIDDLIEKLVEKTKDGKGKPNEELVNQINLLKQTVLDKEKEVEEVKVKYVNDEINRHFSESLNKVPLAYDADTIPKQRELIQSVYFSQRKLEKRGDTIVPFNSKGERINDKLGDPLPVLTDLTDFVKSYGFKLLEADQGGRGSSSSQSVSGSSNYKGKTFDEALAIKNATLPEGQKIKSPHTEEGVKFFIEYEAANKP